MGRYVRPTLIIIIAFFIVGSCNGSGGNSTTTRTIGPEGGTITSTDGRLTLIIPAGALDDDTEISIRTLRGGNIPEEFRGLDSDRAYELSPDGLEFNMPVTAELLLDEDTDINNASGADLEILLTSSGGFIELPENLQMNVDADMDVVTTSGDITHFSSLTSTSGDATLTIENLPDGILPPDTIFEPTARVSAPLTDSPEAVYTDSSMMPVSPNFFSPVDMVLIGQGELELELSYTCGNGIGLYRSDVNVKDAIIVMVSDPESANPFEQIEALADIDISLSKTIICLEGSPPPTATPPPPPPPTQTPPPPPPIPTFDAPSITGLWDFECEATMEAFPLIIPNLGDPFMFQADIVVDPETLETMINPMPNIFMLQGPLVPQQNGDFQFNGSGSGFLSENPGPNDANIQIETEDWIFSQDPPAGFEGPSQPGDVFSDGVLRFNFPTLPLDNQSSRADCEGIRIGD